MNYSSLPLCSSEQVCRALERLGCYRAKARGSSHLVYHRKHPTEDKTLSAPVVLGKSEIPRGTLRSILQLLDISLDDFLKALR
ncbi:MAG: type II toxin-antitoxin system HicA family toxin [Chloroflexi bacterium]|nr:type II toxin-antitoxin system HicA family toxin [Chloroflexota bacterium]